MLPQYPAPTAHPVEVVCRDGVPLGADLWAAAEPAVATVVVNPATGVPACYYHRYAAFLARHGFDAITYDYRGIGRSRPASLRGLKWCWRDWGEKDFDTVLRFARTRNPTATLLVVGHSIGGFLPGFSDSAPLIGRMLTVGAQYACWRDYADGHRARLLLKWHVLMPMVTAACGYFPGRRLGWLEDLPPGVANEWSFRRARMELSYPRREREQLLQRFTAATAPILAVAVADDEYGTVRAIRRALSYYSGAPKQEALLTPADFGLNRIGHFGLFHDRHAADFWLDTLLWLRDGINPWPAKPFRESMVSRDRQPPRPDIVRYY